PVLGTMSVVPADALHGGHPIVRRGARGAALLTALGRFARRKPLGAVGAAIVLAMLLMAVFAERIAPYGYAETIRGARMKPPSLTYWLGTDNPDRGGHRRRQHDRGEADRDRHPRAVHDGHRGRGHQRVLRRRLRSRRPADRRRVDVVPLP